MVSVNVKCPFCSTSVIEEPLPSYHNVHHFHSHMPCGAFAIDAAYLEEYLISPTEQATWPAHRIAALLSERHLRHLGPPIPLLIFGNEELPSIPGCAAIRAAELLFDWPSAFDARLQRAFCNLVRQPGNGFGRNVKIAHPQMDPFTLFAENEHEQNFILETLQGAGWITVKGHGSPQLSFRINPTGWLHFDELVKGSGDVTNPVFVAMWFGKQREVNKTDDMTRLYNHAIARACHNAGWRVMRADSEAHNNFIMGRIIENIRMAPFLVADLTENNNGVYYEAGFARGLGKSVIYCCPEGEKPHFDVSGVNQVRYKDHADLLKKLYDRILGTCGRGPHRVDLAQGS